MLRAMNGLLTDISLEVDGNVVLAKTYWLSVTLWLIEDDVTQPIQWRIFTRGSDKHRASFVTLIQLSPIG